MTGTKLNEFDVALCAYSLTNIRLNMTKPAFDKYFSDLLEPSTLAYLTALGGETKCAPLLLPEFDLFKIATDIEHGSMMFDKAWEVDERVHRRVIACTREIRETIALAHADEWAKKSAKFASDLERERTRLRRVKSWLEARNVLPDLPTPKGEKPISLDPERIDLGKNQEGRAERQRNRRNPDDDD